MYKVRIIWPYDGYVSENKLRLAVKDAIDNGYTYEYKKDEVDNLPLITVIDILTELGCYTFHKDWAELTS